MKKNDELITLLANRLTPTNEQVRDWLQSHQIRQWLTQQMMGITNTLKTEMVNAIIKSIAKNSDKDCRVQDGDVALGVDVLRWQLWASYRLPFGHKLKTPDCPYTLQKHLEGGN